MRWTVKQRRTRVREEQIRTAVWRAQLMLATRTPSSSTAAEPDSVVGATVEHSGHIETALTRLLNVLGPNHALTSPVFEANLACADVSLLHESWAAHCAERARPDADDTVLALDREFPDPAHVRAWVRYEAARQRAGVLAERLAALEPQLAAVTGRDLSTRLLPATA
ncbi:hypothetical protein F7Q99_35690 [Streptomyces kaniharaensis]|uniref:Uncharacterized protein n=1 Tax=Streptomyces kaniharaensis TaxID=212423 RepID=A0A6N7L2G2_9ACTN|nr:hypothetical protein [Streptomyces kaniharaensis]MQS17385.1 hypothetical protein [Streptomyces kaniharaensis]